MKPIALCCAAALVAGSHAPGQGQALPTGLGSANTGLRMAISSATTATETSVGPQFDIVIENVGDSDVVVNLGFMLSNGKVMFPEAIRLVLTDPRGTTRELQYFDRRIRALRVVSTISSCRFEPARCTGSASRWITTGRLRRKNSALSWRVGGIESKLVSRARGHSTRTWTRRASGS